MYLHFSWSRRQKTNTSILILGQVWPCLARTICNSMEKIVLSNTRYKLQAGRMLSSTHPPPWNSTETSNIEFMTVMLHTKMLVFFSLFCYFYVKSLVLKALNLSTSKSFFLFRFQVGFPPPALVLKWNLSCTGIDSPYVWRKVIKIYLILKLGESALYKKLF